MEEIIEYTDNNFFQVNEEPDILTNEFIVDNIKNVMLIDKSINYSSSFFNSPNDITIPIGYNYYTSNQTILNYLESKFTKIDRLCFIFDNSQMDNKMFLNNEVFFTENDIYLFNNNSNIDDYSSNVKFVVNLIKQYDYLLA